MADYTAKWRIEGENGMQRAFRSILGDAKSTSDRVGDIFRGMFAGLSVATVTAGMARSVKAAAEFGDEMQKASLRTGATASEFATLAGGAKLLDVELATLSKGLRTLMINESEAVTGNKKAQEAFAALGIQVETFRALKPQQQLEEIAERLMAIASPADRARLGSQLFGRSWEELAPFLLQGADAIREATEQYKQLNGQITDEQIQRLADTDQAIKNLTSSFTSLSRELISKVSPALTNVLNGMTSLLSQKEGFAELAAEWAKISAGPPQTLPMRIGRWFAGEGAATKDRERKAALEAGLSAWANPGSTGAPKVPGLTDEETADERAKRIKAELARQFPDIVLTARQITVGAMEQMYRDMDEATQTAIERQVAQWVALESQIGALRDAGRISPAEASKRLEALTTDQFEDIRVTAKRIPEKQELAELSTFAEQAARNMQDSFAEFFYSFDGGLKGMLGSFLDTVRRMAAEMASQELLRAFFSWGAGAGGGVGSFFAGMAGSVGARATGGDVKAGEAYWVGERRRRELFVPGVSGTIVPEGALGGGGSLVIAPVYNIDARGATMDLAKALPAILAESNARAVQQAKASMRSDLHRYGRIRG